MDFKFFVFPFYIFIEVEHCLVLPTGTFKVYYFSEELKYDQSLGYKMELIVVWELEKDINLFKAFVEPLYEIKKVGNGTDSFVFKLCLNTLYRRWRYIFYMEE